MEVFLKYISNGSMGPVKPMTPWGLPEPGPALCRSSSQGSQSHGILATTSDTDRDLGLPWSGQEMAATQGCGAVALGSFEFG